MEGIKDRLLQFLEYLGIGQSKFEKIVGLSNGLINNIGDSLHSKTINKISVCYPELNTSWLLTGEGNMLLTGKKTIDPLPTHSVETDIKKQKELGSDDFLLKDFALTHKSLVDSHKIQAEAILSQTRQGEILVETNRELVTLLKSNLNAGKESQSAAFSDLTNPLLEKIARAGVPELWPSMDEGQLILDRLLAGGKLTKKL